MRPMQRSMNTTYIRFFFELKDFIRDNFIHYCLSLEGNNSYTFIMRIATTEYKLVRMAGRQIGLVLSIRSIHAPLHRSHMDKDRKLEQFENLFYRFHTQLNISLDMYHDIGELSLVEILVNKTTILESLKIKDITKYLNKDNTNLL